MNRRTLLAAALPLSLTACAPYVLSPLSPGAAFAGPRMETDAFIVQDGARLPVMRWGPTESDHVFLCLHGINDSAMSFHYAGPYWAERGVITYAYDERGFGGSPGRGMWPGRELMTRDLKTVAALVRARHPHSRIVLVGESMGGAVITCASADDDPPSADGVILLAPAVWGWSTQAIPNRVSLNNAARFAGAAAVEPPEFVSERILASDNFEELMRMGRDPKQILSTRFDVMYGLVDLMEDASQALGRVRLPTLLMYGAHDQLVDPAAMKLALERAGSAPNLTTAFYPNGWHLLHRDLGREIVLADALSWMNNPTAPLPSRPMTVPQGLERIAALEQSR